MTQIPRTFWMVYGAGQNSPTVRHKTADSALSEARRLARLVPDVEFFVLQTVAHVVKRDVEVTPMDDASRFDMAGHDGIPF